MILFDGFSYSNPDSYSRQLDKQVSNQERPYGYDTPPPSADTHDFNQSRLETDVEYTPKKKRK